uniref:hypothetical protein n=1 Tax=Micrococcus luteus TaxID=1270 RepID=UPI0021B256BC
LGGVVLGDRDGGLARPAGLAGLVEGEAGGGVMEKEVVGLVGFAGMEEGVWWWGGCGGEGVRGWRSGEGG